MILLRKLNSTIFALNPDLIETIEAHPDTTIRLTTKSYQIVLETTEEIIEKIIEYRRKCNEPEYMKIKGEQGKAE